MKPPYQELPKGFEVVCDDKHIEVAVNKSTNSYLVRFVTCVKNGSEAKLSMTVCPKEPCGW